MLLTDNQKHVKRIFIEFLKKNRKYASYCKYSKENWGSLLQTAKNYIDSALIRHDLDGLISGAFVWDHTKEGQEKWFEICRKWNKIVIEQKLLELLNLDDE